MTDEAVEIPDVDEDVEVPQGYQPNAVPCKIHLVTGKVFVVNDVHAWGYVPQGVFASGHFKDNPQKDIDLLIVDGRIDFIELDYVRLKKFLEERDDTSTGT